MLSKGFFIGNGVEIPDSTNDLINDSGFITGAYNNTSSGLTATDIQAAIDELKALIDSYHPPA